MKSHMIIFKGGGTYLIILDHDFFFSLYGLMLNSIILKCIITSQLYLI